MSNLWILRDYYKRKVRERFWLWLAWKLPKALVHWTSIRLIVNATTGEYGNTEVPDLTAMDALKRWD